MLVYAADVAETVRHAGRYGICAGLVGADWPAIRERVFARIDPLSEQAVAFRRRSGVDVHRGEARFVAPRMLEVGGEQLRGERIVLTVGSRPRVPEIVGLAEVPFHTSDTIMRVDALPASMVGRPGSGGGSSGWLRTCRSAAMAYIVQRKDRFYVVAYDGTDPVGA